MSKLPDPRAAAAATGKEAVAAAATASKEAAAIAAKQAEIQAMVLQMAQAASQNFASHAASAVSTAVSWLKSKF